ncbi:MAG: TIGR03620 family F420-dependent LLM class oxidoreductase [Candidatus Binataceae bacterium]
MDISKTGLWFFLDAMNANDTAEFARSGEKLGYSMLWIPEAVGRDPFAHAAYMLTKTERLIVSTGIANIYARDPLTMSSGAKTVGELSGSRFVLAVGVSHKHLVSGLRGHDYSKPYSYMREYLSKMKSAPYKSVAPREEVPILIGAINPKMIALAASETQGTHTYFCTPEHTARTRAAMGPKPWICAAQAVILETDAEAARAAARNYMQVYLRAPNYLKNLRSLGWSDADFANNGSDKLVDAIVAWGIAEKIQERIDAHRKAGATHVCIIPVRTDNKPLPDMRAVEALAPH